MQRGGMGGIKEFLRSCQLFGELTEDELDKIIRISREEVYEPGTTIFVEGALAAVESYHRVMLDGYAGEVTEKQKICY